MCGRFAFYSAHEAMPAIFGVAEPVAVAAAYNIAPTELAAVIRLGDDGARHAALVRWGLIPFWAKDPSIGNRLINARVETVRTKPAFRAAYRHRRCLVPADGFYEWHTEGSGKQPYFISARSGEPFAFAGLWERWQAPDSDSPVETFTILTRDANDYVGALHTRMPVIVAGAAATRWLDGSLAAAGADPAFPPTAADTLIAWPVDRRVNNPRNKEPGLIEAAAAAL